MIDLELLCKVRVVSEQVEHENLDGNVMWRGLEITQVWMAVARVRRQHASRTHTLIDAHPPNYSVSRCIIAVQRLLNVDLCARVDYEETRARIRVNLVESDGTDRLIVNDKLLRVRQHAQAFLDWRVDLRVWY